MRLVERYQIKAIANGRAELIEDGSVITILVRQ